MNLYDFLVIKKNVISDNYCINLMEVANKTTHDDASVITNKEIKEETDTFDFTSENVQEIPSKVTQDRVTIRYNIPSEVASWIQRTISESYIQYIGPRYNCEFDGYEPAQLLGYPVGGHYIKHNDSETFTNGKWKRVCDRDISFIFYLNEEFGGGELEFEDLGLTIKPKRGMMVVFPSYYEFAHQVHPVTWGHRYSIVGWLKTKERIYDR